MSMPGSVVWGDQKLCKWNPYGSSRPRLMDLQTVNKQVMHHGLDFLSIYAGTHVDILKSGNVVPNTCTCSFHFYAR